MKFLLSFVCLFFSVINIWAEEAVHANFVRIPVRVQITEIDKGFVQESPYQGAPAVVDLMHTDYRLKSMSMAVLESADEWVLQKYGSENIFLDERFRTEIQGIMDGSGEDNIGVDLGEKTDYPEDIYRLMKRHRKLFSSKVNGPLVAHGILSFGINIHSGSPIVGSYFNILFIKGPRGEAGEVLFPEERLKKEFFNHLHDSE